MLIEDGYTHSLKALLEKSRADRGRTGNLLMSDIAFPRWVVIVAMLVVLFCLTALLAARHDLHVNKQVSPLVQRASIPPPRPY